MKENQDNREVSEILVYIEKLKKLSRDIPEDLTSTLICAAEEMEDAVQSQRTLHRAFVDYVIDVTEEVRTLSREEAEAVVYKEYELAKDTMNRESDDKEKV